MITLSAAPWKTKPSTAPQVTRTVRKIALCGSHSASLEDAPWLDPSWEFWGHASSRGWYGRPMDRYFDLHPKSCWTRGGKKSAAYPQWLAQNTVPIYMQEGVDLTGPKGVKKEKYQFKFQAVKSSGIEKANIMISAKDALELKKTDEAAKVLSKCKVIIIAGGDIAGKEGSLEGARFAKD